MCKYLLCINKKLVGKKICLKTSWDDPSQQVSLFKNEDVVFLV